MNYNIFQNNNIEETLSKLRMALYSENMEIVDNYFKFNENIYPIELQSIFCKCAEYGRLKSIEYLLNNNLAEPDVYDNKAFYVACLRGHFEIVKFLIQDKRVNPSDRNNRALIEACSKGHFEIVQLLLKNVILDSGSESYSNSICLEKACSNNRIEVVKILLSDNRFNPSARNNSAIKNASKSGYIEIVRLLLKSNKTDWRKIHVSMIDILFKETVNTIYDKLAQIYLVLNSVSPKMIMDNKIFNSIPNKILKKICYQTIFFDILKIKSFKNVPSIQLSALYFIISKRQTFIKGHSELCKNIKKFFYHYKYL